MTSATKKSDDKSDLFGLLERAAPSKIQRFDASATDSLKEYGFSTEEIYRLVAPRRTLARRAQNKEPLTTFENDRVLRILRVCQTAERTFDDWSEAEKWLREPSAALHGVMPIQLLKSETGARLVEDELIRIEHGIFL